MRSMCTHTHTGLNSYLYRCYMYLHSLCITLSQCLNVFATLSFVLCMNTHTHTRKMVFPSHQKITVREYMLPYTGTNSLSPVFVEHVHLNQLLMLSLKVFVFVQKSG